MYKKPVCADFIDKERLFMIPDKHKMQHELCFLIHDYMTTVLVEAEQAGADDVRVEFRNEEEAARFEQLATDDVLSALEILGYESEASKSISNQVTMRLYSDMLHFIYEGLIALEKRKFTVAIALLRKPLKENLFMASWLCGDPADFHRAFKKAPDQHMDSQSVQKSKRIDVFTKSINSINNYQLFSADLLYAILYDKNLETGLSIIFDKATHLVTGSKPLLKTERSNLNFIFKNPLDDDLYEFLYFRLAYLLIYAFQVQCTLFGRMRNVELLFQQYASLVMIGSNNCLFDDGRYFTKFITKTFKEFSFCPHCRHALKFRRHSTARLLMSEQIICETCNEDSHFPLFWLLSKADWTLSAD